MGIQAYREDRGKGLRIGVVDTGVGPHPYLTHCEILGAFCAGGHDPAAGAGVDAEEHGTHVAGIIGARPSGSANDFAGIAPGAELYCARVYPARDQSGTEAPANNGDIAAAIDALVHDKQVDLINLSLGGSRGSQIEQDAIESAIDSGALVICAAGNGNGGPVMYPAAYPGCVAVSAIGMSQTVPPDSTDALAMPPGVSAGALFPALFNNTGPQIACAGPGVGIIAPVPGLLDASPIPYAAMSGTSMATPAICGALANLLSTDEQYLKLPRDRSRAIYAWSVLRRALRPLGFGAAAEGFGVFSVSV